VSEESVKRASRPAREKFGDLGLVLDSGRIHLGHGRITAICGRVGWSIKPTSQAGRGGRAWQDGRRDKVSGGVKAQPSMARTTKKKGQAMTATATLRLGPVVVA
jgi:hypothetical protein